ncbi:carboxypeptidase D [Micractinium conductrix]|uniref:Carboxypeptidase D n=1 Tax=Micractinium conductrix TaxID=554055 RepID=A0A2P6VKB9_9CHLO|nr:carboxypeptidase D [Micractinium conductrix]|eukprot:PSC74500.1 carboxypeptidase D [Micractinium conductrix]
MTNEELIAHMKDFAQRCSSISKLHRIGASVRGVPLYVLEISDRPGVEEAEPNFKYIANMHGTEPGGRQLLLTFAEWLCANWKSEARAKRVVQDMHMWLMPTMNPDGYKDKTYENAAGVNLNRDFPDPINSPSMDASRGEQPETRAVMDWVLSRQWVASANMHEGAFVVNYPFDGTASGWDAYNATQDDATFRHVSKVYAKRNPRIRNSTEFKDGITNGAGWYVIYGGMQDWNYVRAGCFEVTLELWDVKMGAPLQTLFNHNLDSMLAYATTTTFGGLRGFVRQRGSSKPLDARITVSGSKFVARTNPRFGNFYRPLAPGNYTVRVAKKDGSAASTHKVTVPESGAGAVLSVTFP